MTLSAQSFTLLHSRAIDFNEMKPILLGLKINNPGNIFLSETKRLLTYDIYLKH